MKILNIEDNTKKLYIQKRDLLLLDSLYTGITISKDLFPNLEQDNNLDEFIIITNEDDIELINCIYFIIDYRHYRSMKITDLKKEIKNQKNKSNKKITKHIAKQLQQIIDLKENKNNFNLPLAIDYYGYNHQDTNENNPYIVSTGIDPNTLFFYRKDQKPLSITDTIPNDFIENAILINKLNRSKQDEIISNYEEKYSTSDDQKYLTIRIIPKTKEKSFIKSLSFNLQQK